MSTLLPAQLQNFSLQGSGVSVGDTSVILASFKSIDGVNLTMADLGSKAYATIEPGSSDREEQISFTDVIQNANGTATLTGVKNVAFLSPYLETTGFLKSHPGGVIFVITNSSGFYSQFGIKENNEVLSGYWEAPDPITNQGLVTNAYMLNLINGGSITTAALIETGTAGEIISAGNVVYLKAADGRWWNATGSTAATVNVIQLGIAQGSGTAGNPITGGVLRRGIDTNQTGGVAGSIGYVSNASIVSTTAGTTERAIGNFASSTNFVFDPYFYYLPTAVQKSNLTALPTFTGAFTGTSIDYGSITPPSGWLNRDGSAVSRTGSTANLFSVIGTTYGAGNGTTTFNLPVGFPKFGSNNYAAKLVAASSQYFSKASPSGLSITGDLSITAWINIATAGPNTNQAFSIVTKYGTSGNRGYQFFVDNTSSVFTLTLGLSVNGTTQVFVKSSGLDISSLVGRWSHVGVSYVASTGIATFYINGNIAGSSSGGPSSIFASTADLNIGSLVNAGGSDYFDGYMAGIKIYNTALSQANIINSMFNFNISGVQGNWSLNNVLTDNSGNTNTLTNNGAATFLQWGLPDLNTSSIIKT